MLKMASESFIHALLLFLGLFLKFPFGCPWLYRVRKLTVHKLANLDLKRRKKKKLSDLSLLSGRSFRAFFNNFAYLVTATSTLILFY